MKKQSKVRVAKCKKRILLYLEILAKVREKTEGVKWLSTLDVENFLIDDRKI